MKLLTNGINVTTGILCFETIRCIGGVMLPALYCSLYLLQCSSLLSSYISLVLRNVSKNIPSFVRLSHLMRAPKIQNTTKFSKTWLAYEIINLLAPLLDILNDDYQVLKFNGTFREFSPYKGPPSSSVDAAWENLFDSECWHSRFFLILSFFLSPVRNRKWPHSWLSIQWAPFALAPKFFLESTARLTRPNSRQRVVEAILGSLKSCTSFIAWWVQSSVDLASWTEWRIG